MENVATEGYQTTLNFQEVEEHIVGWLKDYIDNAGLKGFVIGVSGGIDSAVVSTLVAKTGYPVYCLEMPIHQNPDHVSRASNHIDWLEQNFGDQITRQTIDLSSSFDHVENVMPDLGVSEDVYNLAGANTRSRMRMIALYYVSNSLGYLVAGTGNKVEDFGVGFFSRGGDEVVDLSPIADLMKSEVRALAAHMGVNDEIINAVPSDGLWNPDTDAGQTDVSDEDQIGANYDELEWAMMQYEDGKTPATNNLTERQVEVLRIYNSFNRKNKFKMLPTPICSMEKLR